jgi:hypothetical protein
MTKTGLDYRSRLRQMAAPRIGQPSFVRGMTRPGNARPDVHQGRDGATELVGARPSVMAGSIEQVVRGLDVPAARLHQLTRAQALQIGVAAGPLIAGRGADVLGIGMPRIFEDIKMWGTAVAMLVAAGFGLGAASGASAHRRMVRLLPNRGNESTRSFRSARDAGLGAIGIWDTASQDADSVGSSPIQTLPAVQDDQAALALRRRGSERHIDPHGTLRWVEQLPSGSIS